MKAFKEDYQTAMEKVHAKPGFLNNIIEKAEQEETMRRNQMNFTRYAGIAAAFVFVSVACIAFALNRQNQHFAEKQIAESEAVLPSADYAVKEEAVPMFAAAEAPMLAAGEAYPVMDAVSDSDSADASSNGSSSFSARNGAYTYSCEGDTFIISKSVNNTEEEISRVQYLSNEQGHITEIRPVAIFFYQNSAAIVASGTALFKTASSVYSDEPIVLISLIDCYSVENPSFIYSEGQSGMYLESSQREDVITVKTLCPYSTDGQFHIFVFKNPDEPELLPPESVSAETKNYTFIRDYSIRTTAE